MGAWPDKSRTCAREAAVDQGTWQNFVLLKHLTFLHTDTRECRGCLKALWTHYHSVHLGLPLSPDLSFRCGRYRCSLHLSSWQAVAAAGAGVGRQGVTVSGMASRLPATATTEAHQALAGRSAGSTRLLNMGVGWGGWESRASHHRFHGNTQHQSHAATPSGWLDIKGREWWQSWTHSDAATPTTGAMLLIIIFTILKPATHEPAPPGLLRVCCHHHRRVTAAGAPGLVDTLHWKNCSIFLY